MHPAHYRLAEAMDDLAGARWTLDPDKRLRAGLPVQGELFPPVLADRSGTVPTR